MKKQIIDSSGIIPILAALVAATLTGGCIYGEIDPGW